MTTFLSVATDTPTDRRSLATDPAELLLWAATVAASADLPVPPPAAEPGQRSWLSLPTPAGWDAWVISWPTGSATGWHDHEGAAGVFYVVRGVITEFSLAGGSAAQGRGDVAGTWSDVRSRRLEAGKSRTFGSNHVHHVVNECDEPALSVHVYAPRLRAMTKYRWEDDTLVRTDTESAGVW
jgi:hypothetical protein